MAALSSQGRATAYVNAQDVSNLMIVLEGTGAIPVWLAAVTAISATRHPGARRTVRAANAVIAQLGRVAQVARAHPVTACQRAIEWATALM